MTDIKRKRKPSQKSIFLKPSLVVGNTKTWVSIGETMQEIATKEELSTMGGAKLVGTSSIGYIDGAVCKFSGGSSSITKYNDYVVLRQQGLSNNDYSIDWVLVNGSTKTIALLAIEFDYIVLQPSPLNNTTYDYHQYLNISTTSPKVEHSRLNVTMGSLPGDYTIIIYNKNPTIQQIILQTNIQQKPRYAITEPDSFTLSADSSTHQLTITANDGKDYHYKYHASGDSPVLNSFWVPDTIRAGFSTIIGPCLGLYTILYYKY